MRWVRGSIHGLRCRHVLLSCLNPGPLRCAVAHRHDNLVERSHAEDVAEWDSSNISLELTYWDFCRGFL